jgi:hypothetical protein
MAPKLLFKFDLVTSVLDACTIGAFLAGDFDYTLLGAVVVLVVGAVTTYFGFESYKVFSDGFGRFDVVALTVSVFLPLLATGS